jgi:hypothetical protein
VLSRIEITEGVDLVPGVRGGDVHDIDVRVGGQRGVVVVPGRDAERVGERGGALHRARGHRDDLAVVDEAHRVREPSRDPTGTHHTPADHAPTAAYLAAARARTRYV